MPTDFVHRGKLLIQQDQFQEAVKVCRLGLLANPTKLEGRLVLGAALMALRRFDEVLAEMRVALEIESENAQAMLLKGQALLSKGDALQALEILRRAEQRDPGDPVIRQTSEEAHRIVQSSNASLADNDGYSTHTKNYPAHRGADGPGYSGSDHITRPSTEDLITDHDDEPVFGFESETSGTVEIDPDIEGVQVRDEIAEPPTALGRPPISEPAIELSSVDLISESTEDSIELSASDLIPATGMESDVRGFDSVHSGSADDPTRGYQGEVASRDGFEEDGRHEGHSDVMTNAVMAFDDQPFPEKGAGHYKGSFNVDHAVGSGEAEEEGTSPQTPQGRLTQPPVSLDQPSKPRAISEMFPDDESGVSKLELLDPQTGLPRSLGDDALPQPPPRPLGAVYQASSLQEQEGLPPTHLSGPGDSEQPGEQRSMTDDMHMIRQGVGLKGERTGHGRPPQAQPQPMPSQPARPVPLTEKVERRHRLPPPPGRRRHGMPLIFYAIVALLVVGGAVFAGFKVRNARLQTQIRSALAEAVGQQSRDTLVGYLRAEDAYARILKAKRIPATVQARARVIAAMAAEFGHQRELAAKTVARLEGAGGLDIELARAYLAIAQQRTDRALALTKALAAKYSRDSDVLYLRGRALLLAGKTTEAIDTLGKALEAGARPAIFVAKARALAAVGNTPDALESITSADKLVPGLPTAVIAQARILAQAGQLPADVGSPETELEAVLAEGEKPLAQQALGVSREMSGWARLAFAEVKIARADFSAAKSALLEAEKVRSTIDWEFSESLALGWLAVGQLKQARAEAESAVKSWPKRPLGYVVLARVALRNNDVTSALAALEKAGDIEQLPEALATRGRARLSVGEIDAAAKDFISALARRPKLREAIIGMAQVELARGDAKGAVGRLESLYTDTAEPTLALAYAGALRQSGDRAGARKVIEKVLAGDGADRAHIELARIERSEGNYKKAQAAYAKAIELSPDAIGARLEAATLSLDAGDVIGARESFDLLAKDAADNGRVLVESARVLILTGDYEAATKQLDKASKLPSAPGWKVARERGRLLLRQGKVVDALKELERGRSLRDNDAELMLLILEAHATGFNRIGAKKVRDEIVAKFKDTPTATLAVAREQLLSNPKKALKTYLEARAQLIDAKATQRELASVELFLGRSYFLDGAVKLARDWLKRSLKREPTNADAHYFLGQLAYDESSNEGVIFSMKRSIAMDGYANPDAWYFLGEAYAKKRKRKGARAALSTYIERWPSGDFAEPAKTLLKSL